MSKYFLILGTPLFLDGQYSFPWAESSCLQFARGNSPMTAFLRHIHASPRLAGFPVPNPCARRIVTKSVVRTLLVLAKAIEFSDIFAGCNPGTVDSRSIQYVPLV